MKTGVKIVGLLLLLCPWRVMAAQVSPQQKKEIAAKISVMASSVKSIMSSFTQTKTVSLLNTKMVSEGVMAYRQPNQLRWEYTTPTPYVFVFNGTKAYMGHETNKMFNALARLMMSTITGSILTDTTNFEINISEEKPFWIVVLVPKKKDAQKMFSKLSMSFHQNNLLMEELTIYEKNEDKTQIKIQNTRVNVQIDNQLFAAPK